MNYGEKLSAEDFVIVGNTGENEYEKEKISRGYFFDALARFKKNKSSVAAAFIIGFLILYAILSPIISPYKITDKDSVYTDYPPYVEGNIPFLNGGVVYESVNEAQKSYLEGIFYETGMNPVIKILGENIIVSSYRGEERTDTSYKLRVNRYYETGIVLRTITLAEFEDIQRYQNETGIQVIYPYVKSSDIMGITGNANIWYKVADKSGTPLKSDGEFVPNYSTDKSIEGAEYKSLRIAGDRGDYIYSAKKAGGVECRICYYNYYKYKNGRAPGFILGTNSLGQDLFSAIGLGARFSLVFALLVSAVNLAIGVIYGAVQGYFGGSVDLALDRIADLLSGMPFIVVTTLFTLHLANRVGPVASFLFAFILTGWISMAALTRKQFYRYKGREYVLAARTLGAGDFRLMAKHILPNAAGTLTTGFALVIPGVINSETTLTYLGIINLSEFTGTTLGTLMAQGQTSMTTSPHSMLFPALYFSLLMISFNLFGNGLRDAFNPSTKGEG